MPAQIDSRLHCKMCQCTVYAILTVRLLQSNNRWWLVTPLAATDFCWIYPQNYIECVFRWFYPQNWFAGRRRLVAQPGGLTLGFAVHLVHLLSYFCLRYCLQFICLSTFWQLRFHQIRILSIFSWGRPTDKRMTDVGKRKKASENEGSVLIISQLNYWKPYNL